MLEYNMSFITKHILKKFGNINLMDFTDPENIPQIEPGQWRTEKTILSNGATSSSLIPTLATDVEYSINLAKIKEVNPSLYTALTQYDMSSADVELGPNDIIADGLGQLSFGKCTLMKPAGIPSASSRFSTISINVSKK